MNNKISKLFIVFIFILISATLSSASDNMLMDIAKMEKLAAAGDPIAQYRMAYRYQYGNAVVKDIGKLLYFIQKQPNKGI